MLSKNPEAKKWIRKSRKNNDASCYLLPDTAAHFPLLILPGKYPDIPLQLHNTIWNNCIHLRSISELNLDWNKFSSEHNTRDTLGTVLCGDLFTSLKQSAEPIFLIAAEPGATREFLTCSQTLKPVKCLQGT